MLNIQERIDTHQDLQELQGKVQEIFILAFNNKYTQEKTIQVLQNLFSCIEEENLDRAFREKYNARTHGTILQDDSETLFV